MCFVKILSKLFGLAIGELTEIYKEKKKVNSKAR